MSNKNIIKLKNGEIIDLNDLRQKKNKDWSEEVPLMFQAQIEGRCQLQREGDNNQYQVYDWTYEWTKNYPFVPESKPNPQNLAFARPPKTKKFEIKPFQFDKNVETKEYKIDWRLVTNSGQDDIIRPIIGARGYPYYSGASMKGAFRRACDNEEQANYYCGKDASTNDNSQPGILRFHGGYPIDNSWTQNLVDLIHPQQEKQVIKDGDPHANKQIALYNKTILRFGISSTKKLDDTEWQKIWDIWEKALGYGLGSRVTAGYGRFQKKLDDGSFQRIDVQEELLSIDIKGQGIASTLTDKKKTPEFRPNMFKATLRGHTLRLLGGITDKDTAKKLTNILWGGIDDGATLGLLGVIFEYDSNKLYITEHKYKTFSKKQNKMVNAPPMPLYNLEKGTLKIFLMHPNLDEPKKQELKDIATALIQFAMLFGGFGKSWRRVDHSLFYPSYLNGEKPMIGCHWEFINNSNFLNLSDTGNNFKEAIDKFINDDIRQKLTNWTKEKKDTLEQTTASDWRESWYLDHVKVYGRIANNEDKSLASKAIYWFHNNPYYKCQKIYKSDDFAGKIGGDSKTGRIWHRMYSYGKNKYIELLTIFPDQSSTSRNFITFLNDKNKSGFTKIW